MSFESITLQTQEKYDLAKTMQASPCELEIWDSATKLCYVLFANIPFIGEYVPSEEQFNDITAAGKKLFQRLVKAKFDVNSLNQLEQKELVCAAIFLTQKMDALKNSDDGQLWKYILSGLGYDEMQSAPSWQSCYKKMTELLRLTVRYFADYGQKYYNTLRIQALAPADSISELFEIINSFYENNLESQYESSDTAFEILTQNIQKRLSDSDDKDDAQIRFGSGFWTLKSSLKYLLSHEPVYMAAVCDAVAGKMDMLLRGDSPALNTNNRWDVLLQEWFNKKTDAEKKQMQNMRRKRIGARIISRKEQIKPRYQLENEDLFLCLPSIRLPEITQRPTLKIFQNDDLLMERKLSVYESFYENGMCYTIRECTISLINIDEIDWSASLNFQLQIYCGANKIYDSAAELFRDYIIFNSLGLESSIEKCSNGQIYAVTSRNNFVEIDDPADEYCELPTENSFQLYEISLLTAKRVIINHTDILALTSKKHMFRCFFTPMPIDGVQLSYRGSKCLAFDRSPMLHVVLDDKVAAQNYLIQFEEAKARSLYEFYNEETGAIEIPLSSAARFLHSIRIKQFQTGKVLAEYRYIILPKFSFQFSEPFYLNRADEIGSVRISVSGSTSQQKFSLMENQAELEIAPWNWNPDLCCRLTIPKVNVTIDGENAFYYPVQIWHSAIPQTAFLQISAPESVSVKPMLGSSPLQHLRNRKTFDLGNKLTTMRVLDKSVILKLIIQCNAKSIQQQEIAKIYFSPDFLSSPIHRDGTVLTWNPAGKFIGESNPVFHVQLENDQSSDPWTYRETMKKDIMERNFNCAPGKYGCRIYLDETVQNSPFKAMQEPRLLWETTFEIAAPLEDRFLGKRIYLTAAYFWSLETLHNETAFIARNDAIIIDIRYDGFDDHAGEIDHAEHFYTGILAFKTRDGRLHYMNEGFSPTFENINPVRFCVENDQLVIFNADAEQLQLNATRFSQTNRVVRILNRKEPKEAPEKLPIADSFGFREENDHE